MPGGSDYNRQRPPRRKSWQGQDASEQDQDSSPDPYYGSSGRAVRRPVNSRPQPQNTQFEDEQEDADSLSSGFNRNASGQSQQEGQPQAESQEKPRVRRPRPTGKGRLPSRLEEEEEDDDDDNNSSTAGSASKKARRKKLYKLLGAEALCLGIIFGLISVFNWMAGDFSGDYMGRTRELGQIRLSLGRLDQSQVKAGMKNELEVEMEYGRHGLLSLRPGEHLALPVGDESFTLKLVSTSKIRRAFAKPWLATFTGHIEGGQISGTIADTTGAYQINLEKNLMTSLFRQTQGHIPTVPSMPLPSLFDEHARAPRTNDFSGGQYPRPRFKNGPAAAPN